MKALLECLDEFPDFKGDFIRKESKPLNSNLNVSLIFYQLTNTELIVFAVLGFPSPPLERYSHPKFS